MGLFDVHAHLTEPRLAAREAEVLANARAAGVTTIVSNGLNPADNEAVASLAARAGGLVKPAFGLYPVDAVLPEMLAMGVDYPRDGEPVPPEDAIAWVRANVDRAVAVGEIGLDHHWVPEPLWALQEERFRALVQIALDADKPIVMHSRKAELRAFEVLVEMGATRVDWHCFGGRTKLAAQIGAHGHWLSIPANARRSGAFTKMLSVVPRERLLLETDCPYLGPERGTSSEPAHVVDTAAYAAEVWGTSIDEAHQTFEANFETLFGFSP